MNIIWGFLITAGVTAVTVTAMLLVRRRAPEGSYFQDGDRASGVFGVLATGFSILLGFIIFLAFSSYDQSRTGAETEALLVSQQVETAQFFPAAFRALFHKGQQVDPKTAPEQSAYDKWIDQTSDREEARLDRIHGAVGVIPSPLWVVLFFADSGEGAVTQGVLMGSVTSVIVLMLLLNFLDSPFHTGVGGLRPVAMERILRIVDQALGATGTTVSIPCGPVGVAS